MHLETLTVERFRCIPRFAAQLPPGRILVVGDNARGKTTLLEAVYYLVTGRSFRTRTDADCVPWRSASGTAAAIRGTARRAGGDSCRLAVTISAAAKAVRIDDQPIGRLAELWGRLHAVLFNPDDLQLIKGPPGERRRYLDTALSQMDPRFLAHLQRYNHALRQRNALLKQRSREAPERVAPEAAPWDAQLARHAVPVMAARRQLLQDLEPRAADFYRRIATAGVDEPEPLALRYAPSPRNFAAENADDETACENLRNALRDEMPEDLRRGQTSLGPHRDDFVPTLAGKPARDYASQGQIRSCVLALRFAEAAEMAARTSDPPILLLDDLASELDPARKQNTLALLDPAWQVFMTTTRPEDFPGSSEFARTFHLPEAFG